MTGNHNVNANGADVTFANSEGMWMNDDTHLQIILRNKNGSTSLMDVAIPYLRSERVQSIWRGIKETEYQPRATIRTADGRKRNLVRFW